MLLPGKFKKTYIQCDAKKVRETTEGVSKCDKPNTTVSVSDTLSIVTKV